MFTYINVVNLMTICQTMQPIAAFLNRPRSEIFLDNIISSPHESSFKRTNIEI